MTCPVPRAPIDHIRRIESSFDLSPRVANVIRLMDCSLCAFICMEASKEFENLSISARVVGPVADSKKPADEAAARVAVTSDGLEKSEKANNTEHGRKHPPKARLDLTG
jgi:hypothetical protein